MVDMGQHQTTKRLKRQYRDARRRGQMHAQDGMKYWAWITYTSRWQDWMDRKGQKALFMSLRFGDRFTTSLKKGVTA